MPDMSLGQWVTRLRAQFDALGADRGGGQPLSAEARRTTGIAANIPPTEKN